MRTHFKTRAGTLAKEFGFYNHNNMRRLLLAVVLILCANGAQAAIPVQIQWLMGPQRSMTYIVEVSADPTFAKILSQAEAKTNTYIWLAEQEGVYHWRVTPQSRLIKKSAEMPAMETSSFASGSFVVLEAGANEIEPVRLKWTADPAVTAYHLRIQEDAREARVLVSLTPGFTLQRSAKPMAVQVYPHAASTTKAAPRAMSRMDPGLVLIKPTPVVAPPVIAEPEQKEAVPLQPLPAAPATVQFYDRPKEYLLLPENRVMELTAAVYSGPEKIFATKGAVASRYSRENVTGGLLTYRGVPTPGLHILAEGTAHSHKATWSDQSDANISSQNVSPYLAQVGVGWDLFFRNPNRRHQLVAELRGAMGQMVYLPVEEEDFSSTHLKTTDTQMWGVGGWYRWSARRWGAGLHVTHLVQTVDRSDSSDASLEQWGGFFSMDPIPYLTVQAGSFSRLSTVKRCSKYETICQRDGASQARASLVAGYLGLGYVLY